jgi:hypothetical protein
MNSKNTRNSAILAPLPLFPLPPVKPGQPLFPVPLASNATPVNQTNASILRNLHSIAPNSPKNVARSPSPIPKMNNNELLLPSDEENLKENSRRMNASFFAVRSPPTRPPTPEPKSTGSSRKRHRAPRKSKKNTRRR